MTARVLWLARAVPLPLDAGDRMYTALLADALARAGASVHFVGLASPDAPDASPQEAFPAIRWTVISVAPLPQWRGLAASSPLVSARFSPPAYRETLDAILKAETYDAIVLDQYALVWALPAIRAHATGNPRIVHIAHDFETAVTRDLAHATMGNLPRKILLSINARRTARAERTLAAASDAIVTLTHEDCESFRKIGARGTIAVIPPGFRGVRVAERLITPATPRRVAIVGSYHWSVKQHNLAAFVDAADARLAKAGIELAIVGGAPDGFRSRIESRMRSGRFHGFVEDLPGFLQQCRMGLVIEAVGGGFKLKVLDYVMTRTPVAGLANALAGQAPEVIAHTLVREDAGALCDAIIAAIDDLDRLNAMQDAAFSVAAAKYDWAQNGRRLLALVTPQRD